MPKITIYSSSNSVNKEINEYHDTTSYSGSNNGSSSNSISGENTKNEQYMSSALGVTLEVLQEQLRTSAASGSRAGTLTSSSVCPFRRGWNSLQLCRMRSFQDGWEETYSP